MHSEFHSPSEDWRELAEKASTETDPEKVVALVNALCDCLDNVRKPPRSVCKPVAKEDSRDAG